MLHIMITFKQILDLHEEYSASKKLRDSYFSEQFYCVKFISCKGCEVVLSKSNAAFERRIYDELI